MRNCDVGANSRNLPGNIAKSRFGAYLFVSWRSRCGRPTVKLVHVRNTAGIAQQEAPEMNTTEAKTYESRLRRMAQRQDLRLIKSRRRDPNALEYGTYGLVDVETNGLATYGGPVSEGYGFDLIEIEAHMLKLR